MRRTILITLCLIAGLTDPANAQPLQRAEPAPEMQKLAFLVGTWTNHTKFLDREGKVAREMDGAEIGVAAYTMKPILGGLVIEGGLDTDVARSWYLYRPLEDRFVWTAVDAMGNYEVAYGGFADGRLVFTNEQPRPWRGGGTIMFRRTYQKIEADSREVLMEFSRDGGETWTLSNIQTETRVKAP